MAKCSKDINYEPLVGQLDGHTQMGAAVWRDFRVLLNTQMSEQRRMARRGGWQKAMADLPLTYGNRDLHDQLLGGTGYYRHTFLTGNGTIQPSNQPGPIITDSVLSVRSSLGFLLEELIKINGFEQLRIKSMTATTITVRNEGPTDGPVFSGEAVISSQFIHDTSAVREPITLLYQLTNDCTERVLVAGTRSRLYAFTSLGSNWRLLADGLGGPLGPDDGIYSPPRFMAANLGNYVLFANGVDDVLAWRIGDPPSGWQAWAAQPIADLLSLGIRSAGVVAAWQGSVFLADLETDQRNECQRILWSDYNNPLSYVPSVDSLSGFVDLPLGERVLRMEPLGGYMRVYTSKAIYNVLAVGGEEVFRFLEIYRGPDSLGFKFALANTGFSHIYLTHSGIVEHQVNLNTPVRLEWMHKAGGLIQRGLNGELLQGYPGLFKGFTSLDVERCDQVVAGYDEVRREAWFSWPTMGAPAVGDLPDPENTRRMTLVLSRIYESAHLVDHGFSAFCNLSPDIRLSLRDWMICVGACHAEDMLEFVVEKEGFSFNVPRFKECLVPPGVDPDTVADPDSIRNNLPPAEIYPGANDENPDLAPTANSLCTLLGGTALDDYCSKCKTKLLFLGASITDFAIKEMTPEDYVRELYDYAHDTLDGTENGPRAQFPLVSAGKWIDMGYETILQSESTRYGINDEKTVRWLTTDFDTEPQMPPLLLHAQIGSSGNPRCLEWEGSEPNLLSCRTAPDADPETRDTAPASFPFYSTGRFVAWRMFVSSGNNGTLTYSPQGGQVAWDNVILSVEAKRTCET